MVETIDDQLHWKDDVEISAKIHNEMIVFSGACTKKNRFGFNQTRHIVVTNKSVYNFDNKSKNKT